MTEAERRAHDMRAMSKAELQEMYLRQAHGIMNCTRAPEGLQNALAHYSANVQDSLHAQFVEPLTPTLWQRIKRRLGL